jgi:uncharacterized protein with GYD domain
MARYLLKVSYTVDGAKGLIAEGGSSRVATVKTLVEGLGGTLESFDFALGDYDAYCIVELPGVTAGVSASLAVAAGGGARVSAVALITAAQMDEAAGMKPTYRAPGA